MKHNVIIAVLLVIFSVNAWAAIRLDVNKTSDLHVAYSIKTVVVGAPEVADFKVLDKNSLIIFAKNSGETTLTIKGERGESQVFTVTVVDSKNEAADVNSALVAAGYKDVRAMSLGTSLLISGNVDQSQDIEDIKSLIGDYTRSARFALSVRKDQQIKIRVTVAEVSKNISNQLGIDWGTASASSNGSSGADGSGTGSESITVNSGYYATRVKGFSFDALGVAINALAKNNLANVITTPSLTVTNGKTASFHGGGEIPIFQQNDNGSSPD